jgi:hypothetical protein
MTKEQKQIIGNAIKQGLTIEGLVTATVRNADGSIAKVTKYHNIIPTVGLQLIADALTSASPTNDPLITHVALGTGTTTPALGDTKLETEVYRNAVASMTASGGIVYATGYFNQTETSGTYKEAEVVANGTGSADTGIPISHVAIDETKTTTQTLTIEWQIGVENKA